MTCQLTWRLRDDLPPTPTNPRETYGRAFGEVACTVVEFVGDIFEVRYSWFDRGIAYLTFDDFETARTFAQHAWDAHVG